MTIKLRRRNTLAVVVPVVVVLLTAAAVVAVQSKSEVQAPAPVPSAGSIVVKGVAQCLPHKDTGGPQTMECAIGLKDTKGNYYALGDSDPQYKNVSALPMGEKVTVVGVFVREESATYPTLGTIKVTKVTRG